jgi:hemoglobin
MRLSSVFGRRPTAGIYHQIGGRQALDVIVEDFYWRVLDDEDLAGFFAGTDMNRLRSRQVEFLAAALGGPGAYAGRAMKQAHQGRGITAHHVKLFAGHLNDSLCAAGIPAETIAEVFAVLAPLAAGIASDTAATRV